MQPRTLLFVMLVAGLVTATGAVTAAPQADSATTTVETTSDTAISGQTTPGNYTRLYIEDQYRNLELKPGQSETVTVTVENGEDESVTLSPRVATPPTPGQPVIDASWVSINADETTLDADESRTFEIAVSVPSDAEIGRYGGMIAFTDETVRYPGRPPQPVHSATLSVEVWQEPTVRIESDTHVYTQLKAGGSYTREITVRNTGDEAVPVTPQLSTENRGRHYPGHRETLDRSWVSIDAPSEIAPESTETVEITVGPPADADRGDYSAQVDLGIKDPTRRDDNSYWQEVDLNIQLWTPPEEPFETGFRVSEATTNVSLTLSTHDRPRGDDARPSTDFDVTFVAPDGREISAERVQVRSSGHVSLGAERRPRMQSTRDETYAAEGGQQQFTYRLDAPQAGQWSVRVMPENTMAFEYDITRTERP
jgi:hypothetical protein